MAFERQHVTVWERWNISLTTELKGNRAVVLYTPFYDYLCQTRYQVASSKQLGNCLLFDMASYPAFIVSMSIWP